MKGVILSGGSGSRLRPFTFTAAKQLVPVANKPVLFYTLEEMEKFGITEVAIIVGNREDEIRAAVGDGSKWGLNVVYIRQDQPRGLSHAVGCAREFVGKDKFLVILGDNFVEEDLTPIVKSFAKDDSLHGMLFTISVPDPRPFGVVETVGDRVVSHVEKPLNPKGNLVGIGYYLFDWHCFEIFDEDKKGKWFTPSARGEYEITLYATYLVNNGFKVGFHVLSGAWIDTGKMEDMLEANRVALSHIKSGIEGVVDKSSSISGIVKIEKGSHITNSTIVGPAIIGENCEIRDSYIGPFTSIHHNARLQNCEVGNCVIFENVTICDFPYRIENSMIGRNVTLRIKHKRPKSVQLQLGDFSVVELP